MIFDENISFDHYFGTYPYAANPAGEPAFHARPGSLMPMFDFAHPAAGSLFLDPATGEPIGAKS